MSLLDALTPDFLAPKWKCRSCGTTYRRNRRTCGNCNGTVFEKLR